MTLRVHLHNVYSSTGIEPLLERLDPGIAISDGACPADAEQVEILVGGFPKAEDLACYPRLRALIVPFAGVPAETQQLLLDHPGIALYNLHYNVVPTAEMAVALLLAAAKFVVPMDRDLRRGDWTSRYTATPTTRLDGKAALILGYGQIGRRIARACQGLGMEVVGVRRSGEPAHEDGVAIHPVTALHNLLPRSDALLMALPETQETRGLVGARELALLRPGALVVNVGRGPTLDEEALYTALRDGSVRAAGIDVWYQYPRGEEERTRTAPSRFPFHELDNVVMSPHRAGWLSESEIDRMEQLAAMLNAAAAGLPMPNQVDKARGY